MTAQGTDAPAFGAAAAPGEPGDPQLCARVIVLLRESVGADRRWPADLGPHTRLDADLVLDSIETAAFAAELRAHYGARVDLLAHIADLDLDGIITLTIGDVARHVAACLDEGAAGSGTREPERITRP